MCNESATMTFNVALTADELERLEGYVRNAYELENDNMLPCVVEGRFDHAQECAAEIIALQVLLAKLVSAGE